KGCASRLTRFDRGARCASLPSPLAGKTIMIAFRRFAFTVLASSTALALASCGSKDNTASGLAKAAPVAAIAAPAGQMWSDVVSATPDGGMRMGNPNAPIKVIEYGALSCPHCAKLSND